MAITRSRSTRPAESVVGVKETKKVTRPKKGIVPSMVDSALDVNPATAVQKLHKEKVESQGRTRAMAQRQMLVSTRPKRGVALVEVVVAEVDVVAELEVSQSVFGVRKEKEKVVKEEQVINTRNHCNGSRKVEPSAAVEDNKNSKEIEQGKVKAAEKDEQEKTVPAIPLSDTVEDSETSASTTSTVSAMLKSEGSELQGRRVSGSNAGTSLAQSQKRKWSRPVRAVRTALDKGSRDDQEEDDEDDKEEKEEGSESDSDKEEKEDDAEYGKVRTVKEPKRIKFFGVGPGHKVEMSDYERERLENIKRNQEMLMFLNLPSTEAAMQVATLEGRSTEEAEQILGIHTPAPQRISKQRVKKAPVVIEPARLSNRIRRVDPDLKLEIGENDAVDKGRKQARHGKDIAEDEGSDQAEDEEEDTSTLMSGDLFFDKETREKAIRVDGHYKGWIHPEVMARYGFEMSAQEAWDANGGGSFSFKNPLGETGELAEGSASKGYARAKGKRPKHDAKMVSKAMFKKNPNAYFYRHNEPGMEQWTGDWTEEERVLFLKVTREFGCGDKWGLFASHIPHRVGYQCSNYYRQVILPEGLVFDPNYVYTSRGKPIYCGKFNQRR